MSNEHHHLQFDDEHQLDLLVDGELAEDQRRELLARLEREPQGWRRCALAFLEAQSWRGSLRSMADRPAAAAPRIAARWMTVSPGTWLAMAASFLLAFALGWGVKKGGDDGAAPGPASVAHVEPAPPRAPGAGARPAAAVTLVVDDATGRLVPVEIPLVEQDSLDERWLNQPMAVPLEVQRALERMGHQVRQERQLVPVQLDGGRQGVVPVDRVEVVPVGTRTYQ